MLTLYAHYPVFRYGRTVYLRAEHFFNSNATTCRSYGGAACLSTVHIDYSVFAADSLLYTVTLTFDLWPSTFTMYRLRRAETMYKIWTQSSNPRRIYCDLNIWPNDLERRVTYCSWLWDNFHQVWPSTTYPCLKYSVFDANALWHAVTLTRWPWKFVVLQASRDQGLYEISAKSSNPRLNYW